MNQANLALTRAIPAIGCHDPPMGPNSSERRQQYVDVCKGGDPVRKMGCLSRAGGQRALLSRPPNRVGCLHVLAATASTPRSTASRSTSQAASSL
jgi:hypothetical protein